MVSLSKNYNLNRLASNRTVVMEVSDQSARPYQSTSRNTIPRRPFRMIRVNKTLQPDRQQSLTGSANPTSLKSKNVICTISKCATPPNVNDDSLLVCYRQCTIDFFLHLLHSDFHSFHLFRVIHSHIHGKK